MLLESPTNWMLGSASIAPTEALIPTADIDSDVDGGENPKLLRSLLNGVPSRSGLNCGSPPGRS